MTDTTDSAAPARSIATVTLVHPVKRDGGNVDTLQLRKPKAGELRGLSLQALLQSDIDTLINLLPRITEPPLIDHEVAQLEAEDLAEIGGTIFGFFMTPAQKAMITQKMG